MKMLTLTLLPPVASLLAAPAWSEALQYPPLSAYLMDRDAEVALARSAAPEHVAGRATVKILTTSGYQIVTQGDNGFVCAVMRGWSAPTYTPAAFRDLVYDPELRAPICYDPVAVRTVLPYQELRVRLAMEGKGPDLIAQGVQAAYVRGEIPKMEAVAFAYMYSADMYLGPQAGHFHPHMMVYAPYYTNAMLGGNGRDTMLPRISDDEGTPFAVIVIPVDDRFAVRAKAAVK
jgi:hypothetical protein